MAKKTMAPFPDGGVQPRPAGYYSGLFGYSGGMPPVASNPQTGGLSPLDVLRQYEAGNVLPGPSQSRTINPADFEMMRQYRPGDYQNQDIERRTIRGLDLSRLRNIPREPGQGYRGTGGK